MKKTLLLLGACAFLLGACEQQAGTEQDVADASPYANAAGIDQSGFDTTVSPREDFNEYANGTWTANAEIPGDRTSYGGFAILRDESEANQRVIIEELAASNDLKDGSVEQKIGAFFASIIDESLVEGKGITPIQAYLDQVDTIDSMPALMNYFGEANYNGIATPLAVAVFPDLGDSTRYMSYIFQSGLALPSRDYYLLEGENFEKIQAEYPNYIASMFELAGFDNAAQRAANVIAIENTIAEAHWPVEQNRDIQALYNLRETANLSEVSGDVDWNAYLEGAGLAGRPELVVGQLSYFESLGDVLNSASLEQWKDYLRFQVLDGSAQFLSSEFTDTWFAFQGTLVNGQEEMPERWKTGVRVINATLGEGVGKVYVDRHFPPEARARMEELVDNLMVAFRDGIQELEWMTDETKAMAEEKRTKMMTKIGYPDEWEIYEGMEIVADNPIANLVSATAWGYQDGLNQLDEAVDKNEWGMTPQTVNAGYNPTTNGITFPAAILQAPFFNMTADDAVNYGAIGVVIGHEIGHAFDDQGRKFDGDGNLTDWWTEEDATAYEASAAALVEQFNGYSPLEGLNVSGQLTLGENIGDLTGLTLAYKAYKKSLGGEEAPVIDGLTGDERFFIGYAQIWRYKAREEAVRRRVLIGPHSPPQFRVNGGLRNFTPFYDTFGVIEGDAMFIPEEERVKIW